MFTKRVWWLAALLALAGCGGGGDNDPDLLLGSWRKLDPATRTVQAQLTFDRGGRVSVQAGGSAASAGLFEADDSDLVIEANDARDNLRHRDRTPYRVSKDRLMLRVLTPTGSHDGIIGTFKGSFRSDFLGGDGKWAKDYAVTWAITFRADDTVRLVETADDGTAPIALEGVYQTIGGNAYETTFVSGGENVAMTFGLADGVIGDLYVR